MTADVELLPLPEKVVVDRHIPSGIRIYGWWGEQVKDYARANVEASTKYYRDMLCQSQDDVMKLSAETEALRAEVERLRERDVRWQKIANAARMADMHSERLAEAIRAYKDECDNPAKDYVLRAKRRDEMFALLRQAA